MNPEKLPSGSRIALVDAPKSGKDTSTATFCSKRLRRMDVEPNPEGDKGSVWVPRPAPRIVADSSLNVSPLLELSGEVIHLHRNAPLHINLFPA